MPTDWLKIIPWPVLWTFGTGSFAVLATCIYAVVLKLNDQPQKTEPVLVQTQSDIVGGGNLAVTDPVIVDSDKKWERHPIETELYRAEQLVETIQVSNGRTHVQRLKLIRKDNEKFEAEFIIIRLYDEAFWMRGRYDRLYQGTRRPVELDVALDTPRFAELVQDANFVLCVGLSSSVGENRAQNESWSHQRAQRLCDWLEQGGFVETHDAKLIPMPLGQALDIAEVDSAKERAQRSAVIIGVKVSNPMIDTKSLYTELVIRTDLENIDLSRYSSAQGIIGAINRARDE